MKKYWDELKVFYLKYSLWIIGGLFFLIMMQICSQGGRVKPTNTFTQEITEQAEPALDQLQPITNSDISVQQNRKSFNSDYLLLLMGLGLFYYVAMKRKWFHKLVPSIVWVSLRIKKQKNTNIRLARMMLVNKTKESLTFDAPVLVFGSPFKKARKFRLKNGGDNVFPLTLTPGTSHKISIDIDQFKQKAGVSSAKLLKFEVFDSHQKKYSSIWKLL
nr:hypothetical protein [uncultured Carboxylicivirga sp.]